MAGSQWPLAERFLTAQEAVYPQVLAELQAGMKLTHWMWFVFPQIAGLGQSETARHYAIANLEAAQLYVTHPVLGARLRQCTSAVLLHAPGGATPKSLKQIFDTPDDLKFCSSMTLFSQAAPQENLFVAALGAFNAGQLDQATLDRI